MTLVPQSRLAACSNPKLWPISWPMTSRFGGVVDVRARPADVRKARPSASGYVVEHVNAAGIGIEVVAARGGGGLRGVGDGVDVAGGGLGRVGEQEAAAAIVRNGARQELHPVRRLLVELRDALGGQRIEHRRAQRRDRERVGSIRVGRCCVGRELDGHHEIARRDGRRERTFDRLDRRSARDDDAVREYRAVALHLAAHDRRHAVFEPVEQRGEGHPALLLVGGDRIEEAARRAVEVVGVTEPQVAVDGELRAGGLLRVGLDCARTVYVDLLAVDAAVDRIRRALAQRRGCRALQQVARAVVGRQDCIFLSRVVDAVLHDDGGDHAHFCDDGVRRQGGASRGVDLRHVMCGDVEGDAERRKRRGDEQSAGKRAHRSLPCRIWDIL